LTGTVTHTAVAHAWMCDMMGHLNMRHYMAMFDDAGFQLLGTVANSSDTGWADVRAEVDFVTEVRPGTLLTIRSSVERVGETSLTCRHVMSGTLSGSVHARCRTVSVHFDRGARAKLALTPAMRSRAETLLDGSQTA
jgi:acyl-CoA thioester hydrolase